MVESDVIGHLIDIEQEAATLLFDAQTEADRRIAEAKLEADNRYKARYEEMVIQLEMDYFKRKEVLEAAHNKQLEEYKQRITALPQTTSEFNALLRTLLEK